jgi:molybdopterin/thiamine biosynthesis adenylyltransferase
MKKMATSNVLIVGLKGLGVEIGERPSLTLSWHS